MKIFFIITLVAAILFFIVYNLVSFYKIMRKRMKVRKEQEHNNDTDNDK